MYINMRIRLRVFVGMLFLVSSFLLAALSHAETKGEPITVVSHVDIIPDAYMAGAEESAARLFRAEGGASRKDKGLVSYMAFQEVGMPNHFTIVETWHDANAYALHTGSPHAVQFRRRIQQFLGSPFDARMLRQIR